jgi:uncharacterized membrane protein YvbJ
LNCRFCGTEIADKAIICYRCGRSTTDPKVAPPPPQSLFKRRRSKTPWVIAAIVLIVLALIAWFLFGSGSTRTADRPGPIIESWVSALASPPFSPPWSSSARYRTARWVKVPAAM